MYQMIAFDMDGTLHGGTGEVFQSAAGIYYLTFSLIYHIINQSFIKVGI